MSTPSTAVPDPQNDHELLGLIHPAGQAFFGDFDRLRPIQRATIKPIFEGRNILVAASTASGKTEAVLAPMVARLIASGPAGKRTRLLVVAPTRALVNDLFERLHNRLSQIGWTCGRQTSDHRQRESSPNVLITTPESFDSTLVNGFIYDSSKHPTNHLLAAVESIFLDEAHFFASTVRGDQLLFLVQRLARLREWADRKAARPAPRLQLCAASATVPEPDEIARVLLGPGAAAIVVAEPRRIDFLDSANNWRDVAAFPDAPAILQALISRTGADHLAQTLLNLRARNRTRKFMVFVQSRAECDALSHALRNSTQRIADLEVHAHHSSLPSDDREAAEQRFSDAKDAVLVSTSTMEVGVDIGGVDVVCLVGPPHSTQSLLQRIGRGNREVRDVTRVIPVPRNPFEARAFAGLLSQARTGTLDLDRCRRHWAVFIQQTITFILQSHGEGRSPDSIIALAQKAWPAPDTGSIAKEILERLVTDGLLHMRRSKLLLGEALSDLVQDRKGDIFVNFDAAAAGIAVYDQTSGDLVAQVAGIDPGADEVTIGGRTYRIQDSTSGRVEVTRSTNPGTSSLPRYCSRRMPRGKEICGHVRRGCGLTDLQAPLLVLGKQSFWFHFGGEIWQRLLSDLYPAGFFGRVAAGGIAVECLCEIGDLRNSCPSQERVQQAIGRQWQHLIQLVEHGRFFRSLPAAHQQTAAEELLDPGLWCAWAKSREINLLCDKNETVYINLLSLLN